MRTVIDIINQETQVTTSVIHHDETSAINTVKEELASDIRLLIHKDGLTNFRAYMAVTKLITYYASGPTSDLYGVADKVHQLNWLGRLLRSIEEPFVLEYGDDF